MATGALDLDAASRRALAFDDLLEMVAEGAATALGADRIRSLTPSADGGAVEAEHARVAEARRFLAEHGRLVPAGLPDPAAARRALAAIGGRAQPLELRRLAQVLSAAADAGRALEAADRDRYPALRAWAEGVPDLGRETDAVLCHIGGDGRVQDGASPELGRLRSELMSRAERLRRRLERLVHDPAAAATIRDDFVTQRNGRFVIPVRTDAPRPIRGIVHGSSSSGLTSFVEPLDTVEDNNELTRLTEAEREEVQRLLAEWTDALRGRREEVEAALVALAELDSVQARARFADGRGGRSPVLSDDLQLREVRHPLLERHLEEQGGRCVPLTFGLGPDERCLVLSGPNTGGKTVALKTLGLSVLMAQAGIPVTAAEARLPLFRQLRADIGDHQSIEADLSTFSAHVRAAVGFLEDLAVPSLVLFDEIGTGTEPSEGAALAQAILEALLERRATTMATTHHGALKAWAATTESVVCAAMSFDEETLRPSYRIDLGAAGVSAGLDIAVRLGLPEALLGRARELRGGDAVRAEAYVDRLRAELQQVSQERSALEQERDALASEREAWRESVRAEAVRQADDARRTLDRELARLREAGERQLRGIRDRKRRAAAEKALFRDHGRLVREARQAADALDPRATPAPSAPVERIAPGVRVRVRSLEREGEIVDVRGDRVQVRLGTATFTVPADDLSAAAAGPERPALRTAGSGPALPDDVVSEVKLIGRTVDEALPELDRFLDRAALAGLGQVRVIHGHGTGRLRRAVRAHLAEHPLVAEQRAGGRHEGGDGATVVRLRS